MLQDLHSHTYYSHCGKDDPATIIEAAIAGGISQVGFSDHNYGVAVKRPNDFRNEKPGDPYRDYFDYISLLKNEYQDRITILRGIEVRTWKNGQELPDDVDLSYYDYALIECLAFDDSVTGGDLFGYAKHLGCRCGIAHTDMFVFIEKIGADPEAFFRKMAEEKIFWEMNVNYDSIHGWQEHAYVKRFFESKEQQDIVRAAGVEISVGFDGHRIEDYLPERVKSYCRKLTALGIRMPFEEI